MKSALTKSLFISSFLSSFAAVQAQNITTENLRKEGLFGFPSAEARTHTDTDELRLQSWNDQENLIVQAIIWNDNDDKIGETERGKAIGDRSSLLFDLNLDQKRTAESDRRYSLNPWPSAPGLRYSTPKGPSSSSKIRSDSKGRGSIRYATLTGDRKVRVDTYVIPFSEIDTEPGKEIGFAYLASSPHPDFITNSIGYISDTKTYYTRNLPRENYTKLKLTASAAKVDLEKIPAGREDEKKAEPTLPKPKIGSVPPELSATDWINIDKAPTLESLKGKAVLIEFWGTWCAPCVMGIPHLNKLHKENQDDLVIVSFTDEKKSWIEKFIKTRAIDYPLGVGSKLSKQYGIRSYPYAFLLSGDGKVAWHGSPSNPEVIDKQIEDVIKKLKK